MKIISAYTWISLSVSLVILALGGAIYYTTITRLTNQQLDRDLSEEYSEMVNFIGQHQRFPKPYEFDSYEADFVAIGGRSFPLQFSDTVIFQSKGKKSVPARAIHATVRLRETNYLMTIVASKESSQSLVQLVSVITLVLISLLFFSLFIINRIVFGRIWKPFYKLLQRLKSFSLNSDTTTAATDPIKIEEFRELQNAINVMAEKAGAEYQSMKAFTENASHEMMTPVALINSKLDNLIQEKSLTEDQLEQLLEVYSAGRRLSQLNSSLLLLVKIDNGLIRENTEIDMASHIEDKVRQFEEILTAKNIKLTLNLSPKKINASGYLIDILLNNLIANAITHNYNGGEIIITLNDEQLQIKNTGNDESLDSLKIFERFQKSPLSEGTGLGLTIARNVCLSYGFQLNYQFSPPYHYFYILF